MDEPVLLLTLIFIAAFLYSSVGHAGASGYLAVMAFLSVPALVMRPTALVLNIVVATIATARFAAAGHFSTRLFWPFAVTSIPFAFIGGSLVVPSRVYSVLVALVLIAAAVRLGLEREAGGQMPARAQRLPLLAALISGALIGLLSGLTGTGGGIFLSPLLLFMGWAETRPSGGVSAAFILVNSIAGLAGNLAALGKPSLHHADPRGDGSDRGSDWAARSAADDSRRRRSAGCSQLFSSWPPEN